MKVRTIRRLKVKFTERSRRVSSALSERRCVDCGHPLAFRSDGPLVTFLCHSCGWSGMVGLEPPDA